jgi:hypothetical protein
MRSNRLVVFGAVLAALSASSARADEPGPRVGQLRGILSSLNRDGETWARKGSEWLLDREYVGQLLVLGGDPVGAISGAGWFKPSQSRYTWEWLRTRYDKDGDGTITLEEFGGPREWFEALDKDRDGALTRADFDWSSDSPLAKATARVRPLMAQLDRDGTGRITPEQWKRWFDTLGRGKGYLTQDDLVPLFLEKATSGKGPPNPGLPPKMYLEVVCAFLCCEVGSLSEGPPIDGKAPSFSLRTVDDKGRITFPAQPDRRGKPLVLIFGSFT